MVFHNSSRRRRVLVIALLSLYVSACMWLSLFLLQPDSLRAAKQALVASPRSATGQAAAGRPRLALQAATPAAAAGAVRTPVPTRTATPSPSATPTPVVAFVPPAPRDTATHARPPQEPAAPLRPGEHLMLGRPVPPGAAGDHPEPHYLYGTTEGGTLEVHHGVEFVNDVGTPLIAAADGTVEVAGSDHDPLCGDLHNVLCGPMPDFYGNLVVLRLDAVFGGQRIYGLYGHMDTISVHPGDRVVAGQPIGTVGMTGVAQGPHVHFEVRLGTNDYAHTRDPLLWLKPLDGQGMLAGRILDANGKPVVSAAVDLLDASGQPLDYSETYGEDDEPAVNADDALTEDFAMGDLPAGQYFIHAIINGQNYQQPVTVEAGHLAFVTIRATPQ